MARHVRQQVRAIRARFYLLLGALVAAAMGVHAIGGVAANETYPSAPIRIVVPWNTGGPNDLIARALADKISGQLRTTVLIENRPGANGSTGTAAVAKSPPDGYTMLVTSSAHTLNAGMYKSLPYHPLDDFAPISLFAVTRGSVLVVRRDFPANTLAEFVAYAKNVPAGVSVANNGVGNSTHIAGELLSTAAGIKLVPVPYRGTAPFVTDLLGGHVQAGIMATVAAIPLVREGSLKALTIFGTERTPSLPDVPTTVESGYPGIEVDSYFGAWFPAKTPRERVELMQREIVVAMKTPELAKLIEESDLVPKGSTPDEFARFLAADLPKVLAIFKRLGIQQQ
jgi:tripartite-type tricarboxylate transporter receptor subunit TctC